MTTNPTAPQGGGEKLAPCPLCGSRAELWKAHPDRPARKAWIACIGRCCIMTREYMTDAEAIAAWNTRATPDHAAVRNEALEEAAKACEQQRDDFLSPEYATGQPLSSIQERFACDQCATAIRALQQKGPSNG